jgi:hypothetical protein
VGVGGWDKSSHRPSSVLDYIDTEFYNEFIIAKVSNVRKKTNGPGNVPRPLEEIN